MGKKQTFNVAGESFKTKKDLTERVRGILYAYKEGETLNMFDHLFMADLLQFHSSAEQKIGCGVASMFVKTNPVYGGNTRGFWLTREDGTSTDFSFLECISPSSQIKKVKSAFRTAIEPFTMQFKCDFFEGKPGRITTCEYTGEIITIANSHVDHKPPTTFEKLFTDFIEQFHVDVESVALIGPSHDNVLQDELVDDELKQAWIQYHNEHAVLRVISATANLSYVRYEAREMA